MAYQEKDSEKTLSQHELSSALTAINKVNTGEKPFTFILTGSLARFLREHEGEALTDKDLPTGIHDVDLIRNDYLTRTKLKADSLHDSYSYMNIQYPIFPLNQESELLPLMYREQTIYLNGENITLFVTTPESELLLTIDDQNAKPTKIAAKINQLLSDPKFDITRFEKIVAYYARVYHNAMRALIFPNFLERLSNISTLIWLSPIDTLWASININKESLSANQQALLAQYFKDCGDTCPPNIDFPRLAEALHNCATASDIKNIPYDKIKKPTPQEAFLAELRQT